MRSSRYLIFICSLCFVIQLFASPLDEMRKRFITPLNEDRPWVYWYWLNGNVTEKGLLADLEAMKAAGIGTAMAFDVGIGVQGKLKIRTEEWYQLMKKVLLKADELGLKVGFHGPGWANTGGPWINAENSMKELIWNETIVTPQSSKIKLFAPKGIFGFYRDIAVMAFPKKEGDGFKLNSNNCIITDTLGNSCSDINSLFDNNRETCAILPGSFDIIFKEPQIIRNLDVRSPSDSRFFVADLFAYNEQTNEYKYITEIRSTYSGLNDCPGMGASAFVPVKAKRFRLKFKVGWENETIYSPQIGIQELNLNTGYRLHMWSKKAGFGSRGPNDDYIAPIEEKDIINSDDIINLTDKVRPDGTLNWKPQSGEWTVLRIGYVSTGSRPGPAGPLMETSLECDKYSPIAAKIQYDNVMLPLFDLVGKDVVQRVFSNYHSDSYEAGWQNWSEVLPQEFQKRRGYDLIKHLVSLTGRVIDSVEETEHFLWDFRRTMADCYAENHIGYFNKRAEADGMFFSTEAYDGVFEDLQAAGHAGMPMTEIWNSNNPELRPRSGAIHAGHIYGRTRIGSEQFTGLGDFSWHPWKMKYLADASMAYGINNFIRY